MGHHSTAKVRHAGTYQRQPTGYEAFIPASLPPDPPVVVTGELQEALSQADRELGRLDGSVQTLPNPDLFVLLYVRKEAVLSSQIEGTQSSLQDLLAAEAQILSPDRPRDVHEVINYVEAMNYGLERLDYLPVSVRLVKEIHRELLRGMRGSRYLQVSCEPARIGLVLPDAQLTRPFSSHLLPPCCLMPLQIWSISFTETSRCRR